jgi:hypothetical protein
MDLGGYVHFIIGGLMTYVSGAAIILSFYAVTTQTIILKKIVVQKQ